MKQNPWLCVIGVLACFTDITANRAQQPSPFKGMSLKTTQNGACRLWVAAWLVPKPFSTLTGIVSLGAFNVYPSVVIFMLKLMYTYSFSVSKLHLIERGHFPLQLALPRTMCLDKIPPPPMYISSALIGKPNYILAIFPLVLSTL